MRRPVWFIAVWFLPVVLLVACSGSDGEQVVTTAPTSTASTTTLPATTSTTTVPTTPTTTPTTTVPALQGLAYRAVPGPLGFPMIVVPWTEDASLVAYRSGRIHSFDGSEVDSVALMYLDVSTDGERGLLGLAVSEEGVFAHYSDRRGHTVVAELALETGEQRVLFELAQPAGNHNGGMLQFGPDGMLYLGLGDGGGANDQFGHGQNTESLLGGIVRLDPETGAAELWSYGLRNPYRFWFDGDVLYIGDVGQNAYEEIDVVEFSPDGYNFGWPITEGLHCFAPRSGCETDGLTLPVVEIAHGDAGTCSVTGGVVYRGTAMPDLDGVYFYSDYCGGWLRSFVYGDGEAIDHRDWTDQVGVPGRVVSFGVDHTGEMYVLTTTTILKIEPDR
ncbi:MAG TPA: PQQ-dependent sugar dehydrogenase [Acidimicrobiia bacterium]|nr:PQQ-dependent sugar dehydrogenase [Acidimicrobiia bacterium]